MNHGRKHSRRNEGSRPAYKIRTELYKLRVAVLVLTLLQVCRSKTALQRKLIAVHCKIYIRKKKKKLYIVYLKCEFIADRKLKLSTNIARFVCSFFDVERTDKKIYRYK